MIALLQTHIPGWRLAIIGLCSAAQIGIGVGALIAGKPATISAWAYAAPLLGSAYFSIDALYQEAKRRRLIANALLVQTAACRKEASAREQSECAYYRGSFVAIETLLDLEKEG